MSYTTVLNVIPGKGCESIAELKNSHGSAPYVWNEMCKKYLGANDFSYHDCIDDLWPLYKDIKIPAYQRAVLMMTYDIAFVSKKYFARAAKDIRLFINDFPVNENHVNHWDSIAKIYEDKDLECEAIGLWCTSVSENPFDGEWNEEKEEYDARELEEYLDIYKTIDSSLKT